MNRRTRIRLRNRWPEILEGTFGVACIFGAAYLLLSIFGG